MSLDKRITGEQNTLAVLMYLHRFGWLTSRMIAALIWPDAKQGAAMARRTVKALADQKLILKRALSEGGDCYALSAGGARWLNEKKVLLPRAAQPAARQPGASRLLELVLIGRLLAGDRIWTEYEIQTGCAPVANASGKSPMAWSGTPLGLVWVEVENAWKNRAERAAIVRLCQRNLLPDPEMAELAPNFYLFRVAIVSTNLDALRAMQRSLSEAHAAGELTDTPRPVISNSSFARSIRARSPARSSSAAPCDLL